MLWKLTEWLWFLLIILILLKICFQVLIHHFPTSKMQFLRNANFESTLKFKEVPFLCCCHKGCHLYPSKRRDVRQRQINVETTSWIWTITPTTLKQSCQFQRRVSQLWPFPKRSKRNLIQIEYTEFKVLTIISQFFYFTPQVKRCMLKNACAATNILERLLKIMYCKNLKWIS